MVSEGLEGLPMPTGKLANPGPNRSSGQAAVLAYLLQNAKLIGRDEIGRSVISLSVDDWLMDQLVAARTVGDRDHRAARSAPEVSILESAQAA
jgi:hypothetical protein